MNSFKALRKLREADQHLLASPQTVFPLLCPIREYEWIEHWRCDLLYTNSGRAEADCIVVTNFPEPGGPDTWIVSRYEPDSCIEFIRFNPLRIMRYSITLSESTPGKTTAHWQQLITARNEEGNSHLQAMTDEAFILQVATLENYLNHFLQSGQMLRQKQ